MSVYGRERADRQDVAAHLNPAHGVERPQVQKPRVFERPEIHATYKSVRPHRHEAALVAQHAERVDQ